MLPGLLKKLKSQKTKKQHSVYSKQSQRQEGVLADVPVALDVPKQLESYKIGNQFQQKECIAKGKVKTIRYVALEGLPDFSNLVLACPISVFNLLPHSQRRVKQIDLNIQPYPQYLTFMTPLLEKQLPNYNHILINDYPPGIGIMPHSDGPAYIGKVIVISLGSYAIISFQQTYTHSDQESNKQLFGSSILLQPNSIHIFQHQAYSSYLHGISNITIDSIFLYFCPKAQKVTACTIDNYPLLACRKMLEHNLNKMIDSKEQEMILQGGIMRIINLEGNSEYNFKIEIQRKERISITIRHKIPI